METSGPWTDQAAGLRRSGPIFSTGDRAVKPLSFCFADRGQAHDGDARSRLLAHRPQRVMLQVEVLFLLRYTSIADEHAEPV